MSEAIRLTQYSHGAGCGCKISPKVLEVILAGSGAQNLDPKLWVGNASRDDAAVYALDEERGVVSTTDFFMPIVDDPFDFGRIAATNAISDIYAMGGDPLMAIAILGWPVNVLAAEVAREVIAGGRKVCEEAGIPLAGGHSIDAPEPIFGLAVTGVVEKRFMKRNDTAEAGCRLYLTKPLGIGILTTAEKKARLRAEDVGVARDWMCTLNRPGARFGRLAGVKAMTDVTGFGLLGHLVEMADGSKLTARVEYAAVPRLASAEYYLEQGWSAQESGLLLGFLTAMEVLSGLLAPALASRSRDRRPVLVGLTALMLAGFLGLAWAPASLPLLWALCLGLGIGGLFPMGLIVCLDHFDAPQRAGQLAALVQGAGYLIAGVSPWIAGLLRDSLGSFTGAWLGLATVAALLLGLGLRFDPRRYAALFDERQPQGVGAESLR